MVNHFEKCCQERNVHGIENTTDADCEIDNLFIGSITQKQSDGCFVTLEVQNKDIRFKIDTGSQANIIPVGIFQEMDIGNTMVEKPTSSLTSYTGDKLRIVGKCSLKCQNRYMDFYIADTDQMPLLGFKASQDLGLVTVVMNIEDDTNTSVFSEYPSVFNGLGCLPQPYHIDIDPSVQPVADAPRNVPAPLRERLKATLHDMECQGVIRKVDEPTDWVNSMVIVEKPKTGQLRVCLDPRNLNCAIRREHFQIPTIEDITTRMSGAKVYSKLDANHGFWQVELDGPSQLLTTFNTPFGRFCYLRLPFGIKSAQEVFQKRMSQHFADLPGVETDIDDILVWGSSREEHDERLKTALDRCQKIHLTLNKEKCEFRVPETKYIGHKLTPEGVKPDESKIAAIAQMPPPEDKKGVERLLGTVNYLAKFVPNLSTITEPIRLLLQKTVAFHWSDKQEKAFQEIKEILTREPGPVLQFYDVNKSVTISCDASKSGLGSVLYQDNKPVAFASRSMTETETRYAQIEKELLAVLFSLERFNQYIYSKEVVVESDHRPLEFIMKKPLSATPPRLQRMLLRLQKYTFTLVYKPGKELVVADTLSRAYLPNSEDIDIQEDIECYVHSVVTNLPVSDPKLLEIRTETAKDDCMSTLKTTIDEGWPENKWMVPHEIRPYWNCRDELSHIDGIIMKGETIVIPRSMRKEMLDRIHVGHMGIAKSRQRARDIMYWPQMNSEIADMVSKCSTCLEHRNSNQKEPMIPSQIPTKPWEMVATDLFTLNSENYLLIVDYYSRYFEVAKLSDTKSATIIMHTKSVFARHGIAAEVRSDNGPQYSSQEYKDFAKSWGFVHVTTSPHFPQANGLVEKTVSTVKSLFKKAREDGKDPYLGLLEYRNTPLDGIGSPAQMLMGRRLRSTIPTTSAQLQPGTINPTKVQAQLRKKQQVQKTYFDRGSKPLSALKTGDTVRIQKGDRWHPATVVEKSQYPRSYVVETPDGGSYRRNRRHLLSTNEPALNRHIEDIPPPTAVLPFDNNASERHRSTTNTTTPSPTKTMTPSPTNTTTPSPSMSTTPLLPRTTTPSTTTAKESVRTSGRDIRKPIRFNDYVT